jgi:hypothetical protein
MKRITKKRLHWLAAIPLMALGGQLHDERWPCPHPWKNCGCLGSLNRPDQRKGMR